MIVVFNSLKSNAEIGRNPLGLPLSPVFQNFPRVVPGRLLDDSGQQHILTWNSRRVCVIAGTSAYAMARLDLPGTDAILLYLFVASAVPVQLFLVPLSSLEQPAANEHAVRPDRDLLGNLLAACHAVVALVLVGLPRDFEDAARIDGANELQVLLRVVLP